MIHVFARAGMALYFSVIAASAVHAQAGPPQGLKFDAAGLAAVMLDTDLDSGGQISSSRWFVEPGTSFVFDPRTSIGVSVGFGQTFYEFEGGNGFAGSLDLDEVSVSIPIRFAVGERAVAFVVPKVSYAAESGVDFGDGSTYGLFGAVAWRLSPTLTLGPGLAAFTTLGDQNDADVFPFLLIDWDITDRWKFSTGSGLAASRGPGLTLSYAMSDRWEFGLLARYESFEFRLDDDGSDRDGIGVDRSTPVIATASWTPGEDIRVTGFAGYAFNGNFEIQDRDGHKVADSDYDPAPLLGVVAEISF